MKQKRVKGSSNLPMNRPVMDCLLIQWYHCPSICFSNRREIFAEKMLARQSRADGWRQHIRGLRGSVVSINGLSKSLLPSSFSTHSYNIMMKLPRCGGQTFKKMELAPNGDVIVTRSIKDGSLQSHVRVSATPAYRREGNCFMSVTIIWNSLFIYGGRWISFT